LLNRVEFSAGTDLDLIVHALQANGYNARRVEDRVTFRKSYTDYGSFQNGAFAAPEGFDVDAIKREYATESVKRSAARLGWRVVIDAKNPQKMLLRKRQ
tara:strand:- start:132 stop:428 length:297 start_codon:yes stop_codon:yes gene_type:complete